MEGVLCNVADIKKLDRLDINRALGNPRTKCHAAFAIFGVAESCPRGAKVVLRVGNEVAITMDIQAINHNATCRRCAVDREAIAVRLEALQATGSDRAAAIVIAGPRAVRLRLQKFTSYHT